MYLGHLSKWRLKSSLLCHIPSKALLISTNNVIVFLPASESREANWKERILSSSIVDNRFLMIFSKFLATTDRRVMGLSKRCQVIWLCFRNYCNYAPFPTLENVH
ncbi:hypothetical protein HHI36_019713 [Cryptolaemus montrouzieri]|uniref:Uncharacterized protein n=1 Tax=Cryptolaemus montrouzieri TaxID=559131 RepID=A0ABD2N839_9CUCU